MKSIVSLENQVRACPLRFSTNICQYSVSFSSSLKCARPWLLKAVMWSVRLYSPEKDETCSFSVWWNLMLVIIFVNVFDLRSRTRYFMDLWVDIMHPTLQVDEFWGCFSIGYLWGCFLISSLSRMFSVQKICLLAVVGCLSSAASIVMMAVISARPLLVILLASFCRVIGSIMFFIICIMGVTFAACGFVYVTDIVDGLSDLFLALLSNSPQTIPIV